MRLQNLLFLFTFFILSGCIPGADKASICPAGQTFDQVKRACSGSITNVNTGGPVNLTTTLTLEEDAPNGTWVYLNYSDPDGDLATACTVSPNMNFSYVPGSCSCDSNGVCKFNLKTVANLNSQYNPPGGFKFDYQVTTNSTTSAWTTVNVTVNPVDDEPYDLSKFVSISNIATSPSSSYLNARIFITGATSQTGDPLNAYKKNFTALETVSGITASILVADFDQGDHSIEILNTQNFTSVIQTCGVSSPYPVSFSLVSNAPIAHIGNTRTCTINMDKDENFSGIASLQFRLLSQVNGVFTSSPVYTIQGTYTAVDDLPVARPDLIAGQTFTEDTEKIITLPYTDVEGDVAVNGTSGCAVSALTNLSISTACSCSNAVCTVGLTPNSNKFSDGSTTFSFKYTVTTASTFPTYALGTSNLSNAFSAITVTGVADNPVAGTSGLAPYTTPSTGLTEDIAKEFTLLYTDYDVSSATGTTTSCNVSSPANGTLSACACTSGVCKVTFTPAANYSGFAGFNYSITRGSSPARSFTSAATVSYNFAAVDDPPVLILPASANTNMDTTIYVPITKLDEGGGSDEDTQTVTLSGFTSTAYVNSISIVKFTGGAEFPLADTTADVSADTWFLKIVPKNKAYGSTSVPVTISDGTNPPTTTTLPLVINPVYALHKGWKNIQALGNKLDHDGSIIEPKFVRLDWEDFDIYGSSILGFNVYRGKPNIDWTTPINTTMIPATQKYYIDTDSTLSYGSDYFYAVRPVDATYSKSISPYTMTSNITTTVTIAESSYGTVKISFPPDNAAYLHRWAVNKELCQKMGKTPDSVNNFRCSYAGPGDNGFYQDFGNDAYVDINEMGCNYSLTDCSNGACIGSGYPGTTGCNGSACSAPLASTTNPILYYDRTGGKCYYSVTYSGVINTWTQVNGTFGSSYARYVKLTNSNLPPLINLLATTAQTICDGRDTGVTERLLKRPEFIAAAAWDTNSLTDATITSLETGADLSSANKYCNSSAAAGLVVSDDLNLPTIDTDTLPSTTTSTHRTLVTGSSSTAKCRSRYGIQDLVGNVREYNLETVLCLTSSNCNTTTDTSFLDPTYTHQWEDGWSNIYTINSTAMSSGGAPFTNWKIATGLNGYNYMFIPYGLPISTQGSYDFTTINGTTGNKISTAQLHDDAINFNTAAITAAPFTRGVVTSGGSYSNGTEAGRWSMEWVPESSTSDSKTGFRCIRKL